MVPRTVQLGRLTGNFKVLTHPYFGHGNDDTYQIISWNYRLMDFVLMTIDLGPEPLSSITQISSET